MDIQKINELISGVQTAIDSLKEEIGGEQAPEEKAMEGEGMENEDRIPPEGAPMDGMRVAKKPMKEESSFEDYFGGKKI